MELDEDLEFLLMESKVVLGLEKRGCRDVAVD